MVTKSGGVVSGGVTGPLTRFPHISGLNARFDAAVADGWCCWRAEVKGRADAGDGHQKALAPQGAVK